VSRTAARALALALIIFVSGLAGVTASAGPSGLASPAPITVAASNVEERQEEDRNEEVIACPRAVARAFRSCAALVAKAARPIVRTTARGEASRRTGHGGRSPGARLLLTLSVCRT
jgi:hypothetical protein